MLRKFLPTLLLLFFVPAMATPEPPFEVLAEQEAFELRRYDAYIVAEVEVQGRFSKAGNAAFRPLFRFISGENDAREKIAMTAPVTQSSGQKIAMTAPVTQRAAPGTGAMHRVGFIMPPGMTLEETPVPRDPRVSVREEPARVVAVARYRGTWSERRYARHEAALLAAVREAGYEPVGEPIWARYNGPMTPFFLRRNEIMVEIAEASTP